MRLLPFNITKEKADIVYPLIISAFLAGLLCLYRLVATLFAMQDMYHFEIYNNVFAILAMAAISTWCVRYITYRLNDIKRTKDYRAMKNISMIAAICCVLRVISAVVYFYIKMGDNANLISYIYAFFDILLWVALSWFFLNSWSEKKAKEKRRMKAKKLAESE